ncbi:MAG: response regulator [bacterium]
MIPKVKTIIIDDEKLARDIIKNYLTRHAYIDIIAECSNGYDAIKSINDLNPDLIFLDIQMPKINGFELLELLENPPVVVFTTAFDQYALKAFEVNAVDYLLKPYSKERFDAAVKKAVDEVTYKERTGEKVNAVLDSYDNQLESLDRVVVKTHQKILIIPVDGIHYLEAQDDYVMIYSELGKHLKQKTMKYFEDHLNTKEFIRIHRSYIVHITQVKQIEIIDKESYRVVLKDGNQLPVSKSGYAKLKEVMN